MRITFRPMHRLAAIAVVLVALGIAWADQAGVRAALQAADQRKPAAEFALKDASGKVVRLSDYRGKVVLVDFWATWCHGCKEEIPWFAEFQRKYGDAGLSVVGISLDDEGWKVVKPFVKSADIPYQIVLGNEPTAKAYGISSMPDTFLIDGEGRVAASYAGIVDRDNLEGNIQAILK